MTTKEQSIPKLNPTQKSTIKELIKEFLPPTENKRKYNSNEVCCLRDTLSLFSRKNLGFNISTSETLQIFDELGYNIWKKKNEMDYSTKKIVPNKKVELYTGKESFSELASNFFYINVPPKMVTNIKRACSWLPPNTNEEKLKENELLKKRLNSFINSIKK